MKRAVIGTALVLGALMPDRSAGGEFTGAAFYEIAGAATDLGESKGNAALAYGFGLGGSYTLPLGRRTGIVLGAELVVRGFGLDVPDRTQQDTGVFAQSDLILDEILALQVGPILAGAYYEQRRIDRGPSFGAIGFPTSGLGFLVETRIGGDEGTRARFSYARMRRGRLRLPSTEIEPAVDSGASLRASVRQPLSGRWGIQGEYSDVRVNLEEVAPTFGFFDHRQRSVSLGAFLSF